MEPNTPEHAETSLKRQRIYHGFLLLLIISLLFLVAYILSPFVHTIILSILLATLIFPLQRRVLALYRGRPNLAAMTMTLATVVVIVLPVFVVMISLAAKGIDQYLEAQNWVDEGKWRQLLEHPLVADVSGWIKAELAALDIDPEALRDRFLTETRDLARQALKRGAGAVAGMTQIVSRFFIMLFILFFLLRDGEEMLNQVLKLIPLHGHQTQRLRERVNDMFLSVVLGNFMTALTQGAVGAVGLWIAGFSPLFWGIMLAISSLIPLVGTGLVFIPTTAYLLLTGQWGWAVFLVAWAAALVSPVDNYLRPIFMQGRAKMHSLHVFLSIIGAMIVFGLPGLLYGPLIFGVTMVVLDIYRKEYLSDPS
jgi:predicted PurR-regulated permease PerM